MSKSFAGGGAAEAEESFIPIAPTCSEGPLDGIDEDNGGRIGENSTGDGDWVGNGSQEGQGCSHESYGDGDGDGER